MKPLVLLSWAAAILALTTSYAWPLVVISFYLLLRLAGTEYQVEQMRRKDRSDFVRRVNLRNRQVTFSRN